MFYEYVPKITHFSYVTNTKQLVVQYISVYHFNKKSLNLNYFLEFL